MALYLVFVVLALASQGSGFSTLPLDSCTPSCEEQEAGAFVPDPTDCNRYYVCLTDGSPGDFVYECEESMIFDANDTMCVTNDDHATCGQCEPRCPLYTCPDNDDFITVADPEDCSKYYICGIGEIVIDQTCPAATPNFNGERCVDDESQCCNPCLVYCNAAYVQIPDPSDCKNYYFCQGVGFPKEEDKHTCEEGNFNAAKQHCEVGAACSVITKCSAALESAEEDVL